MKRWPDFFIVGAPKAGTTSLWSYLKNIPDIFLPDLKEPHYFSLNVVPNFCKNPKPIRDQEKYLELYKSAKSKQILGDASPSYLSDEDAPSLIYQINSKAKIIIILRDPVEREYSHYLMGIRLGIIKSSFTDFIQKDQKKFNQTQIFEKAVVRCSYYFEDIQLYLDIFGPNQVKIIIFEKFIKNPKKILQEILYFLNIDYKITELNQAFFVSTRDTILLK